MTRASIRTGAETPPEASAFCVRFRIGLLERLAVGAWANCLSVQRASKPSWRIWASSWKRRKRTLGARSSPAENSPTKNLILRWRPARTGNPTKWAAWMPGAANSSPKKSAQKWRRACADSVFSIKGETSASVRSGWCNFRDWKRGAKRRDLRIYSVNAVTQGAESQCGVRAARQPRRQQSGARIPTFGCLPKPAFSALSKLGERRAQNKFRICFERKRNSKRRWWLVAAW